MNKNDYYPTNSTILQWAEADRPREKLILQGRQALTDAELLAILIGSGTTSVSAVDVGKIILQFSGNNLSELGKKNVKELTKIRGIGVAKAVTIIAALELGRRRNDSAPEKRTQILTSRDAYLAIKPYLLDKTREEFWILLLSRNNRMIRPVQLSVGGISATIMDPKLIFKTAIEQLASSIIMIHNHPSGNLKPSLQDEALTNQICAAGQLLDLPVLDHLIFTDEGFFSFRDNGKC